MAEHGSHASSFFSVYQKTENLEGRKRVIGYQLILIEEAQMRIGDTSGQQGMGVFDNKFETSLVRHAEDLKNRWKGLCSDDDQRQQQADQNNHPKQKGEKGDASDPDQGFVSLDSLLVQVNVLFARASASRFL